MYKLMGLWSAPRPEDVDAFEEQYAAVHVPLASQVPNVRKVVLTRADNMGGEDPAYYRLGEMLFDSPEAMAASSESDEWHAMHSDAVAMMERFNVSMTMVAGWENPTP